jgi:hypothetical protein
MSPTTHALISSLLSADPSLSITERDALRSALGEAPGADAALPPPPADPSLLVTQTQAAGLLGVNRTTVWRLTGMGILRPVEISPGTKRYEKSQVETLAKEGYRHFLKPARLRKAA